MKIMVVDDDYVSREKLKTIANTMGECIALDSGKSAVKTFINTWRKNEKKFDLVLLDFDMPKMNGLEVLIEIRKAEEKRKVANEKQVKVIMTTSFNDREVVMGCKAAGCNHYILKPITREKVASVLKNLGLAADG